MYNVIMSELGKTIGAYKRAAMEKKRPSSMPVNEQAEKLRMEIDSKKKKQSKKK